MIDSHAHLYFDAFDADRDAVIERARQAGIAAIVNIAVDVASSEACIALAAAHQGFFASVGIHPTTPVADEMLAAQVDRLRELAGAHRGRVVAVGEIGLDYHWREVPGEAQKAKLRVQLALARELGLPVIFHCREALPDLFEVLEAEPGLPGGVFHCFAGGPEEARRALALGFHVSFAGNVTYPRAGGLQEAARAVPPEKLLLETDAPFLAPQAHRGKRNEPAFLPATAAFLARLKGVPENELIAIAAAATRSLFRLPAAS